MASQLQHYRSGQLIRGRIPLLNERKMLTTAIALFGARISPRFDCAQSFLLITTSDDQVVTDQRTETISDPMPIMKVKRLSDLKVNTLICGGVDGISRQHLNACGIHLVDNMRGKVIDTLCGYFSPPPTSPLQGSIPAVSEGPTL